MKILSIKQPWASAILMGEKEIENRTWVTGHRGPLLIHASAQDDAEWVNDRDAAARLRGSFASPLALADVRGAILGVVELMDIQAIADCQLPFARGPMCWRLGSPRIFRKPVVCRGFPGLFAPSQAMGLEMAARVEREVTEQLATAETPREWHARRDAETVNEAAERGEGME